MFTMAEDDGVDPVHELCNRSKGVWVQARGAASSDEGVDPMDQTVADQGPARVPLCEEPGKVERLGFWGPSTAL